jgi:diguanylate cyclase (GGDEF)-like protein
MGANLARLRVLRPGLLGRFTLLSLLAVTVLGFVVAQMLQDQIRDRALANAEQSAELIGRFGFQPQLSNTDLSKELAPEAIDSLDHLLSSGTSTKGVKQINVLNAEGRVVYSSDHRLIGRSWPDSGDLEATLRGDGRTRVNETPQHVIEDPGTVIDANVPLRFSDGEKPVGMLELHLDYGPVAATIARDTRRLYIVLGLGLLLLWGVMYRIAAGASRELRHQSNRNAYQARHDSLTGLPNRDAFYEAVTQAIDRAHAGGPSAAAMIIDLDRFKEVNDTLGHHSGDLLLRQAAERLGEALRESDLLARLGGDEFAVLLPTIGSEKTATEVAGRIRAALEPPFQLQGMSIHVGGSVGIAIAPEHGKNAEDLIQRADVAMYLAKESRSSHEVYSSKADPYSPGRLAMVAELRTALSERQLELYYQPKASLTSGTVAGVEALVRWIHPERGLIPPNDFIPLAEQTGLIDRLTVYVLDEALRQCSEWREQGLDLAVAVNLSARNIADGDLPDLIHGLLADHDVDPSRLVLELTESTLMIDPARAKEVLERLHAMGVALAIDDFGTGYSSLSYLSELPVTELKIDRSFVMSMATSDDDAFIVRATIDLGRNLGLRVVAEGVETESVWNRLAELGCDVGQGYYLSRPVPADELTSWMLGASARGTV